MNLVLLLILVPHTSLLESQTHTTVLFPPLHLRRRSLHLSSHRSFSQNRPENMFSPAQATVELDFLGIGTPTAMDHHNNNKQRGGGDTISTALPKSPFQKFLERGRSFRGIQAREVIPNLLSSEVLKSVIMGGKSVAAENAPEKPKAKPMTVFYGGNVSVFEVTPDKFESLVKLAMEEKFEAARTADQPQEPKQQQVPVNVEDPNGDLPIARRKSLQRFLEKRKERLNTVSPYGCHTNNN